MEIPDAQIKAAKARLVLLSFLMLFVELFLIRWTGSNVMYLAYFSNFVLLGSFLGIGIGFLRARSRVNLFVWAPAALALLIAFVSVFPVKINRSGGELIYFGEFSPSGLPPWVMLPLLFVTVAAIMAMIAEGVARAFVQFKPLDAYRLDVIGAILGIASFALLSFTHSPPLVWGLVIAVAFIFFLRPLSWHQIGSILLMMVFLAIESVSPNAAWSPYYKVTATRAEGHEPPIHDLQVNGIPHQRVESTSLRAQSEPLYFLPYERITARPDKVLVIGAGTGSDVAIALAQGASHVDAVEIDPLLYEIGKNIHPDRPYDDPRVDIHVDDGRAFLERTNERYDLILFALPDSLTLVSGQASLRLESYLFTLQAFQEARDHLTGSGMFAMYNYYREPWLIDRLAGTLREAFGTSPCVDSVGSNGHFALLAAGTTPASVSCASKWTPTTSNVPSAAQDDHPFLYLRSPGLPGIYASAVALILLASLVMVRALGGRVGLMRPYLDLFFMGAAFMLLETKNVVQFALLFGTTWFVNALVFVGILLAVLLGIEIAERIQIRRRGLLYLLLAFSLLLAWAVPLDRLLELDLPLRFVASVALAFTPIVIANVVFADRFRSTASSSIAFGANLLGAMVGGVLEYASLMVGYKALLLLTIGLYGLAFSFTPRLATSVDRGRFGNFIHKRAAAVLGTQTGH